MRCILAFALMLAALAATGRSAIGADLPSPANSTIPGSIRVVGADAFGHPDPVGMFAVTYRDLANNPIPGARIRVDFSAATDIQLCGVQGAGVTLVAGGVEGITDANGAVTMTLLGHAIPNATAQPAWAVRIFADDQLLGGVPCAAFDLDGVNGVSGADLSLWLADFVSATNPARGDYDNNAGLGGNDLKLWLEVFTRGTSAQSCPGVVTAPE
jgi:hypothetical protein